MHSISNDRAKITHVTQPKFYLKMKLYVKIFLVYSCLRSSLQYKKVAHDNIKENQKFKLSGIFAGEKYKIYSNMC